MTSPDSSSTSMRDCICQWGNAGLSWYTNPSCPVHGFMSTAVKATSDHPEQAEAKAAGWHRVGADTIRHWNKGWEDFALIDPDEVDGLCEVLNELTKEHDRLRAALEEAGTLIECEWAISCERMRTEFGTPDHPDCRACTWLKAALTPTAPDSEAHDD